MLITSLLHQKWGPSLHVPEYYGLVFLHHIHIGLVVPVPLKGEKAERERRKEKGRRAEKEREGVKEGGRGRETSV